MINENHNHAIITEDGVLHRKGATPADKGQIGVIPGNMKDGVYVTVGLGNEEYLSSASHGAGRRFSRRKAKETISISDFENDMKGIVCKVDNGTLDESPSAYKDINMVIERQEGIVIEVVDYLKPLVNIKG
jgi:tRNA-splicing ligase RtcB